jgi:hypothetical protein
MKPKTTSETVLEVVLNYAPKSLTKLTSLSRPEKDIIITFNDL